MHQRSKSHLPHIALFLIAKSRPQTGVVDTVVVNALDLFRVGTTVNGIPQNDLEMVAVIVLPPMKVNPTDQYQYPLVWFAESLDVPNVGNFVFDTRARLVPELDDDIVT